MTFEEVHPGRVLREELTSRSLSATSLALKLRVAPQRFQKIIAGKRGISPETALRLGRFFGNEPEFWLSMQANYDLAMLRKQMGERIAAEVEVAA